MIFPDRRLRVVFMGTPAFALPSFKAMAHHEEVIAVVTQPDRPSGRGMTLTPSPIKIAALEKKIPVYQPERIRKDAAFIKTLADLAPDLIIVVAFGQILPEAVLKIPPFGCINVHASLLPKFRGAAPIQWAIIHGEKTTGITIMQMDVGMDTGPMLLQKAVDITPSETAGSLSRRLADIGADLLVETITKGKRGEIKPISQKDSEATPAPLLKKEEGRIRWDASAEAIFNRWRGVFTWPGTTAFYDGEPWKIVSLEIGEKEGRWGAPGQSLKLSERGLEVAAGIGYIIIGRLKRPGGREISPAEYAAGHPQQSWGVFL